MPGNYCGRVNINSNGEESSKLSLARAFICERNFTSVPAKSLDSSHYYVPRNDTALERREICLAHNGKSPELVLEPRYIFSARNEWEKSWEEMGAGKSARGILLGQNVQGVGYTKADLEANAAVLISALLGANIL